MSEIANVGVSVSRAHGLRGIFHDDPVTFLGECGDWREVGGQSEQMNRHDGPRPRRGGGLNLAGVYVERDGINVHEYWFCTNSRNGPRRCNKREWSSDDLVASSNARCHKRKHQ